MAITSWSLREVIVLAVAAVLPLVVFYVYTHTQSKAAINRDTAGTGGSTGAGQHGRSLSFPFHGPPDGEGRKMFRSALREDFFEVLIRKWGPTFTLDTITVTADPSFIRALLFSRTHSLPRSWLYRLLGRMMPYSDGILFMEGEHWRVRHREFTPLFAGGAIRNYTLSFFTAAMIEADAHARATSPTEAGTALSRRTRSSADLLALVRWSTLRMLLAWGFGLNPDDEKSVQLGRTLDEYARTCLEIMPHAKPPVIGPLYHYVKLWPIAWKLQRITRQLVDTRAIYNDNSNAALRATAAAGGAETKPPATSPPNFATRMLDAGFTIPELTSEVNHVHGAHKAAAFVTTCTLFELSVPAHAHWREAVKKELIDLLGAPPAGAVTTVIRQAYDALPPDVVEALYSRPATASAASEGPSSLTSGQTAAGTPDEDASASSASGAATALPDPPRLKHGWRPPERADLERHLRADDSSAKLKTTCRVWKESLRRHVVSMGVMRKLGEPFEYNGVTIPAGHEVQILLHALHTLPEHWGEDAHTWNPDRWLPGASNGMRVQNAFFPFLAGIRRCAGMYLAELEFLILLYVYLVIFDVHVLMPEEAPGTPTAVIPDGRGGYKLRMAPDMFSAIDGPLPYRLRALSS